MKSIIDLFKRYDGNSDLIGYFKGKFKFLINYCIYETSEFKMTILYKLTITQLIRILF